MTKEKKGNDSQERKKRPLNDKKMIEEKAPTLMPTSLTLPSTQSPSAKAAVSSSPIFLLTVKNTFEQVMVGNDDLELLTLSQVLDYETLLTNQALNNTNMNNIELKLINQTLESSTTT